MLSIVSIIDQIPKLTAHIRQQHPLHFFSLLALEWGGGGRGGHNNGEVFAYAATLLLYRY